MAGRVGEEVGMKFGKQAAQQTGSAILSTLKAKLGNLNRTKPVVKILGMVNGVGTFGERPKSVAHEKNLI